MSFSFSHHTSCQRRTHESCCIKIPPMPALVDRLSDWPDDLMPQELWDLLRKPTLSKIYNLAAAQQFSKFTGRLLMTFSISIFGYFFSESAVMGYYVNGLPSGPFHSDEYIRIRFTIGYLSIIGLAILLLPFNERLIPFNGRLKRFVLGTRGIVSLLTALACVVLRLGIIFNYLSSMRYLVAGAWKQA